jgi:surfeit locus 1 family protein
MAMRGARTRFLLVTVAALATVALTARLGFWQLDRAAQKLAIQAAVEQQAQRPPLDRASQLPADAGELAALQQRRVRLAGRWLPKHTVFLDNRPMNGRPGFYVVTPLLLADGRALLVQRGWVARDPLERTRLPAVPSAADEVTVTGRIAPWPARLFEFEGVDAGAIRQNLDFDAFTRETGLRLLALSLMQTAADAGDDGLLRDWPNAGAGVDKHHGYAFQWFGLSGLVLLLYVWFQFIQPRRTAR